MTPDEHAAEAERLLATRDDDPLVDQAIARAHVHALLATRTSAAPVEPLGSYTDDDMRAALREYDLAKIEDRGTAERRLTHALSRIEEDDRREQWIMRVSKATANTAPRLRRAVAKLR